MLQIKDVCKEYRTGSLVQKALDHVSLNLRDNEFVAILGPSGSGKTTLLNIIGGLDRYDSGDLVINGTSTKRYKDRDWDAYRNHTIGFVFQSYNLIPHQTVLANVELALTIGGTSRAGRRQKAIEALEKVGLGEQLHKKPNQMSGGQMQRVAIARALVNDPDILLADEPTGALDSETSVQVMELLKEVAKDRLVVMVTHNPELAQEYATRIVNLKDGQITDDSDPLIMADTAGDEPVHRRLGRASMSFLTALLLSFNNLWTKKARTFLVAFAGSIGIIGIALISSLSSGANIFIKSIEEDTLSEYPMEITGTNIDMSLFGMGLSSGGSSDEDTVWERPTLTRFFSQMTTNDLVSFREYLMSDDSHVMDYAKEVEYGYDVSPLIFKETKDGTYRQVNPDTLMERMGMGGSGLSSAFSSMMSMDSFFRMPEDPALYVDQYEIKAGRWPENINECILIVGQDNSMYDITLYIMGLKDPAELDEMLRQFSAGEDVIVDSDTETYDYEDFIGIDFKWIPQGHCFQYDATYNVWKDKTEDAAYMKRVISEGGDLKIVGVARQKAGSMTGMLSIGIGYLPELTWAVMDAAADTEIVGMQLADDEVNVFTGKRFDDPEASSGPDLASMFVINEDAFADVFKFDMDEMSFDMTDLMRMEGGSMDFGTMMDLTSLAGMMPDISMGDLISLVSGLDVEVYPEELEAMLTRLQEGFTAYAQQDPSTDYTKLIQAIAQYLAEPDVAEQIRSRLSEAVGAANMDAVGQQELFDAFTQAVSGFPEYAAARLAQNPELLSDPEALSDPALLSRWWNDYYTSDAVQSEIAQAMSDLAYRLAQVQLSSEAVNAVLSEIAAEYEAWALINEEPIPKAIADAFVTYIQGEEASQILSEGIQSSFNLESIQAQLMERVAGLLSQYSGVAEEAVGSMMVQVMSALGTMIEEGLTNAMTQMADKLEEAFSIEPEAFADAISMNMDEDELKELMMSMMTTQTSSYDNNLSKLGYADRDQPTSITIYPKDFESKQAIVALIDDYNTRMEESEQEDKVIAYTDMVGTLMSSVTDIVNVISYVLMAFVAISLVVSSIMIGVITYISVLERRKEIGILRALGASKGNVSSVFKAETVIIGFLAGVIGIGITLSLIPAVNYIIHHFTSHEEINAVLPPATAVILIILSVVLTLIGGLIPSGKAARQDPVTALRTE